ncbi:hypothetical protein ASPTUDRAFT_715184 [Aspergillus tubingensis CBS 134.48]|uniref:Uncharacterized protein n=1 Tax=Aspergillus tubingensis (strain CBS 134.48) TaxID=767770 RepID=A0A1L9N211_ASPTC|nr:hypothetical protein ASPTUDRAFT_715184 [Aspergillus tubingensis CBS 134.48]
MLGQSVEVAKIGSGHKQSGYGLWDVVSSLSTTRYSILPIQLVSIPAHLVSNKCTLFKCAGPSKAENINRHWWKYVPRVGASVLLSILLFIYFLINCRSLHVVYLYAQV